MSLPLTWYIKHLVESANFKVCTFNKLCNDLEWYRFKTPNVSYTQPLGATQIKRRTGSTIQINTHFVRNNSKESIILTMNYEK
jgi:hypothetical protein